MLLNYSIPAPPQEKQYGEEYYHGGHGVTRRWGGCRVKKNAPLRERVLRVSAGGAAWGGKERGESACAACAIV